MRSGAADLARRAVSWVLVGASSEPRTAHRTKGPSRVTAQSYNVVAEPVVACAEDSATSSSHRLPTTTASSTRSQSFRSGLPVVNSGVVLVLVNAPKVDAHARWGLPGQGPHHNRSVEDPRGSRRGDAARDDREGNCQAPRLGVGRGNLAALQQHTEGEAVLSTVMCSDLPALGVSGGFVRVHARSGSGDHHFDGQPFRPLTTRRSA